MPGRSSLTKTTFLGMSYGMAMGRLRRNVRYRLLAIHGENQCYVCHKAILAAEEISLEHKRPWLNQKEGRKLFWDLNNIAFSHRRCNKPHNRPKKSRTRDMSGTKTTFLGMPIGTASNRLWRNVLHHLLVTYVENDCHVCKEAILTPEELSLEHKEPWEGRVNGVELFWDLDNIAFSHRNCNKQHNRNRKIGQDGTSWCYECRGFLPNESFTSDKAHWNGKESSCRQCSSRTRRTYARADRHRVNTSRAKLAQDTLLSDFVLVSL